jgi:ribonuclease PH
MKRADGRAPDQIRELKITRNFIGSADGSVLIECGRTRIIVTAVFENLVPPFLVNTGQGWLSAEYSMLPGSTPQRKQRDGRKGGNVDGRSVEIQRIIGRALRCVVDTKPFGQRTLWIDCDVIEADGSTRTTSINGAYVALYDALQPLRENRPPERDPLRTGIAAVSVGIVDGTPLLDLTYEEDSRAEGDFNFIMSHDGDVIEIQGSAEKRPIPRAKYDECVALAHKGLKQVMTMQNMALLRA